MNNPEKLGTLGTQDEDYKPKRPFSLIIGKLQQNCISDVNNKAKKFISDTSKLVKTLKNLTRKDCYIATIVDSLRQVHGNTILLKFSNN
jgi:hypothetical protein